MKCKMLFVCLSFLLLVGCFEPAKIYVYDHTFDVYPDKNIFAGHIPDNITIRKVSGYDGYWFDIHDYYTGFYGDRRFIYWELTQPITKLRVWGVFK